MEEIINFLLNKKAGLREEIEREFEARTSKIDELLSVAGYVPPVEEIADKTDDETAAENAADVAGTFPADQLY